jgi:hypothetical protein
VCDLADVREFVDNGLLVGVEVVEASVSEVDQRGSSEGRECERAILGSDVVGDPETVRDIVAAQLPAELFLHRLDGSIESVRTS